MQMSMNDDHLGPTGKSMNPQASLKAGYLIITQFVQRESSDIQEVACAVFGDNRTYA